MMGRISDRIDKCSVLVLVVVLYYSICDSVTIHVLYCAVHFIYKHNYSTVQSTFTLYNSTALVQAIQYSSVREGLLIRVIVCPSTNLLPNETKRKEK